MFGLRRLMINDGEAFSSASSKPITRSASRTADISGLVTINKHLGTAGDPADGTLSAAVPKWTSACTLSGLAYLYVQLKYDSNAFSGLPTITAACRVANPSSTAQAPSWWRSRPKGSSRLPAATRARLPETSGISTRRRSRRPSRGWVKAILQACRKRRVVPSGPRRDVPFPYP